MCFHRKEYKYLKDGRLEDVLADELIGALEDLVNINI